MANPIFKKLRMLSTLFVATLALLGAGSEDKSDFPFYDEVFDGTGAVRPVYQDVYPIYSSKTPKEKKKLSGKMLNDFQKDNALDVLPRILTESEYDTLRKGVEQRGTALRMFLRDYYAGKWDEIEKIIPRTVLNRIVARSSELDYQGRVDPESISFPYGPDIIRDSNGGWRVIEDNPGYIGGPGDLILARKSLFKRIPEYQDVLHPVDSPEKFYQDLVERYKSLSKPADGKMILYSVPPFPDHEDDRLIELFEKNGVDSILAGDKKKKLVVNKDGVFLRYQNKKGEKKRKRIGFIVLNAEHQHVDTAFPATFERALIEEAKSHLEEKDLKKKSRKKIEKALRPDPETGKMKRKKLWRRIEESNIVNELEDDQKSQVKNLVEAMLKGKVATNYSPGVDFIGDKEFYVYVEDLVRHYLKEEPILRNLETERFGTMGPDGKVVLNEALMERAFRNQKDYVLKAVDGRGGDSVWVGASIPAKDYKAVKKKITSEPERYIAQKYTHLSVMDGKIVDLRMISSVDPKGVYVSPTPWGRAILMGGDGKVNISSSGFESAIAVVKDPKPSARPRLSPLPKAPHSCVLRFNPVASP